MHMSQLSRIQRICDANGISGFEDDIVRQSDEAEHRVDRRGFTEKLPL
jgi:putative aminopeptidase FrvX